MPNIKKVADARINEDYIVQQVNGFRDSEYFTEHKDRLSKFDMLYAGNLVGLFPNENFLPGDMPFVENKLKNSCHDLTRLAAEAKGTPVFVKEGESDAAAKRARLRQSIADTLWNMARGPSFERKLYMDAIAGGMQAVSVFMNSDSDYPQAMRLNPRFCYPDVRNGTLYSMTYMEDIKERVAARVFPDAGLDASPENTATILLVQYIDYEESVQAIFKKDKKGNAVTGGGETSIRSRWVHKLGCVPVAFKQLDTADDHLRGLLDQVAGPLMTRNKTVRLMIDYLEDMTHAPFEARGILNADEPPGPTTIYRHDPNEENASFMRRVAPAAPAGSVFGLLQYLDAQEQSEAIQPPARVGTVSQSIASGSFVESTQGSLSSTVRELQDMLADLRVQFNTIAMKIDERHLNKSKALYRPVGSKSTYMPEKDIGEWYYHDVQYGAAAGLDRREADVRILQLKGAGLIDNGTARSQIDFIANDSNIQDDIDREQLGQIFFQRMAGDPNVPLSIISQVYTTMGEGKTLLEAISEVAPQITEMQEQQQGIAQPEAGPGPAEEQASLEAGAIPSGGEVDLGDVLQPQPFTQISVG